MTKRFLATLVVAAMAMTVASLIAAPQADAGNDCELAPVLYDQFFFESPGGVGTSPYHSGEDILADVFEGDRAELTQFLQRVVGFGDMRRGGPEAVRAWAPAMLEWLARPPCNDAIAYNGPFTNHPPAPTGAYGWGAPNVVAAAAPAAVATGGGDAAAPLAHTGLDTAIPGMLGATMLGAGLLIEGGRRRRKNA